MRIKRFNFFKEGVESNELYYYRINVTPTDIPIDLFKLENINFSDYEVEMIKELNIDKIMFGSKDAIQFIGNQSIDGIIEYANIYLEKYKSDHISVYRTFDEWFITEIKVENRGFNRSEYYRCDQIEGLVKFIKDYKSKKISKNTS